MSNHRERVVRDDEIDLIELIRGLWQQKLLIILTTLVVGGAAVAYALLATPVYEAKVFVQPPSQNDIAHLNYGRGGDSELGMLTVKDVYDVYVRNLQSESLRRRFFQDVYLPALSAQERLGSQDELYEDLSKVLKVTIANKEIPTRFAITVNMPDPNLAVSWAVQYGEMAGYRAKLEILKDLKADASVKANNLERQITTARENAKRLRDDQIAQLEEALTIAKSINLERPPIISGNLSTEVSAGMDGALTYMRGSKALQAEIENLQKRGSDDPFIRNLREQQSQESFYRSLEVDPSVVGVYRQDGALDLPDSPIKPKRFIVVFLGVLAGAGLGITLALFRRVWSSTPKK
ncbi:LPS O-antigen chain length determinant protein WzzB [Pseudomonas qingdaonensis]|uniref:LPS O-antigen chain length determinant protein WzzB n=1 Tax=Pseudomonas qingdaonensis TaxID=2056231 RepID=UPI00242C9E50|nr:Wzz/FepE/Etk N-terminal domain-containing protein [Pseudomonas qingdaonensis]